MTLNGETKPKKRPLWAVIFRIAAILGILGVATYVVAALMQSSALVQFAFLLLGIGLTLAAGNAIVLLAMKPKKS